MPDIWSELANLQNDPRLSSVIGPENPCVLSIWMLEIERNTAIEHRLLYAWIIPSQFQNPKLWYSADGGAQVASASALIKYRMPRLTLYHKAHVIFELITLLCKGLALNEACKQLNLPITKKFGNLQITQEAGKNYSVRPVIFCPTNNSCENIKDEFLPTQSPSCELPAFSAALTRLNKLELWTIDGKLSIESEELARASLQYLFKETGFDFSGSACARIGDLEWLALTGGYLLERSYVSMDSLDLGPSQPRRIIEISIPMHVFSPGQQVALRCRAFKDRDIILDKLILEQSKEPSGIRARYLTEDAFDSAVLTVWVKDLHNDWQLWTEKTLQMILTISGSLGIGGTSINIHYDWLEKLINSRAGIRAAAAQSVRQTDYRPGFLISRDNDARNAARRQTRDYVGYLYPQKSEGRFFAKGWSAEEAIPGKLGFLEWFREITATQQENTILIIDPFFDTSGIELLTHVQESQVKFVILTNSQKKSVDDQEPMESTSQDSLSWSSIYSKFAFYFAKLGVWSINQRKSSLTSEHRAVVEPLRAIRIRESCARTQMMLSALNIRILDLRSNHGGDSSLIHDRYILILNPDGSIQRGFSLSNSIQGATKKAPLLVTPIPNDIIKYVHEYTKELLAAAEPTVSEAKIVELYSSTSAAQKPVFPPHVSLLDQKYISDLFALLLAESALVGLTKDELANKLSALGAMNSQENRFIIPDIVYNDITRIVKFLEMYDDLTFVNLWFLLGELLVQTTESNKFIDCLASNLTQKLKARLEYFLTKSSFSEHPLSLRGTRIDGRAAGLMACMRASFGSNLGNHILTHGMHCYSVGAYAVRITARILARCSPETLVKAIHQAWRDLPIEAKERDNVPRAQEFANFLCLVLHEISDRFSSTRGNDVDLTTQLLLSPDSLNRSLGAQSLYVYYFFAETPHDRIMIAEQLSLLEAKDHIKTLAKWAYEVRIRANQHRYCETAAMRILLLFLFEQIEKAWSRIGSTIDEEYLREIFALCNGPGGPWFISTDTALVESLISQRLLPLELAAKAWLSMLWKRIESAGVYVFDNDDEQLTQIGANYICKLSQPEADVWIQRMDDLIKSSSRTVRQPFIKTRDNEAWLTSYRQILWCNTFLLASIISSRNISPTHQGLIVYTNKYKDIRQIVDFDDPEDVLAGLDRLILLHAELKATAGVV